MYRSQSALTKLGLYYRAVEDGDLPSPHAVISPSRFLGAKGATRPRPLSGGFNWSPGSAAAAPGRQPGSSCGISGVLPVVDDEMMAEYRQLTTDLGVRSVLIFSNIEGLPLDDDSIVNGSAAAMRCGLEFFGAERVMYGTDFPMGSNNGEDWPVEVLDTIRSLGLSAADQELLLGANLGRIMRL